MDDSGFDALARDVASLLATRRGWLGLVGQASLAGVLAAPVSPALGGRRRRRKTRHDPGADKERRKGKRKGRKSPGASVAAIGWPCADDQQCAAGLTCAKPNPDLWTGYCQSTDSGTTCAVLTEVCVPGERPCCGDLECRIVPGGQSVCVPPAKPNGARCGRWTECEGGRCRKGRCRCREDLETCGADCVDLQTHPRHCGACGTGCSEDEFCFAGTCAVGGGGGWGWGGAACSFPAGGGFCWGFPFSLATSKIVSRTRIQRRGVNCEFQVSRFTCPLCAPLGEVAKCGQMDDPTPEQLTQHCKEVGFEDWKIVSCHSGQCEPGETLCTHWCRQPDTLCPPPGRGSFVPSVEVCTTQPDRYCPQP